MEKFVKSVVNYGGLFKGNYYLVVDENDDCFKVKINDNSYWRAKGNFTAPKKEIFDINKWKVTDKNISNAVFTIYSNKDCKFKFLLTGNKCDVIYTEGNKELTVVKGFEILVNTDLTNLILDLCREYNIVAVNPMYATYLTIIYYINKQEYILGCQHFDNKLVMCERVLVDNTNRPKLLAIREFEQEKEDCETISLLLSKYLSNFVKTSF